MRYVLLVYRDEKVLNDAEREECDRDSFRLVKDLNAAGIRAEASPLHPVSTATSVRIRRGRRLVADGPFAETREQLGGYFIVEAKDLDEAIGVAARVPGAKFGTIEIRPVVEIADRY